MTSLTMTPGRDIMLVSDQNAGLFCFKPQPAALYPQPNIYSLWANSPVVNCATDESPAIWSDNRWPRLTTGFFAFMATSKFQAKVRDRLRSLLKTFHIIENHRPDWLMNPLTGFNLEIDFWVPEIKLAIEVQGRQHQEYVDLFHASSEDFQAQLKRDETKRQLCKKAGVFLYEIYQINDIDKMLDVVMTSHPDNIAVQSILTKNQQIKTLCYLAAQLYKTSKKLPPDPTREEKLVKQITSLAERYDIPLRLIEPDFSIKKMDLSFVGKPIVRVKLINHLGNVIKTINAAVMSAKGDIVHLRWHDTYKGRQFKDMNFDLTTGKQVDGFADNVTWEIKHGTVICKLEYPNIWPEYAGWRINSVKESQN